MRLFFSLFLVFAFNLNAANEGSLNAGLVNPGFYTKPSWFKDSFLDIPEDVAEAAESDKRLLLLFHQDGCPYCEKLLKENFTDPEIVNTTRRLYEVVEINMWGDREIVDLQGKQSNEKELAKQLKVQFTPTLLFLNKNGEVEYRANGYYAPAKFLSLLNYLGESDKQHTPSFISYGKTEKQKPVRRLQNTLPHPLNLKRQPGMRPLAVIFEKSGCDVCDEYHQHLQQKELQHELSRFDLAHIDLDSQETIVLPDGSRSSVSDWSKQLSIQYTPSILFFDHNGQQIFATEAYLRPFHLKSAFSYVSSAAYIEQPEFQRFVQQRADHLREQGIAVDLWK